MKSLEEYIELSKKIQAGDITMIKPKNKKGSGLTTVVVKKPKRNIKKLALLPDTYLETKDELISRQESLLQKYEKIQQLRKKARNIPYTSLIKEYKQILGKDYVPELDTDPGDVVESYIVRGKGTPTYHYYYRFKQDSSIPIEQYLPLMKEIECLENKSGDMFTFRFHVYQKTDGTLKVQGLDKYDYNQVMEAFKNVLEITTKKTTKKSNITISQLDFEIIDSLGMFTNNELFPYKIENYNAVNGNTQIKINRITRQKIAEKGGGLKPFSFKPNVNTLTTIIEEEEEVSPAPVIINNEEPEPESPIFHTAPELLEIEESYVTNKKIEQLEHQLWGLQTRDLAKKNKSRRHAETQAERDLKINKKIEELDTARQQERDRRKRVGSGDMSVFKEIKPDFGKNLLWKDSTIKRKFKIL